MSAHVLFAVNNYPPLSGGVEQHVFELARQLVADGIQCTVVTLSTEPSDSVEDGIRVIRLPRRGNIGNVLSFPHLGTRRWLVDYIRQHRVSAVSVHTRFFPLTWIGTSAAIRAGVPAIHTEHGSAHVRGVSAMVGLASWMVDVTLGRRALRQATIRLAVSRESAAFVKKLSGKSATVFPNATNVSFWHHPVTTAPSRFVFVGRMVPKKGWAESIDAFTRFAQATPDSPFELHLVGDGAELTRARDLAAASPVAERIHVHGRQSHEQIRELLSGQWLVNPTQLSEGFQTTLLEAAAAGAGIISYPAPGLDELQASGATVLRAATVDDLANQLAAASQTAPHELTAEQAAAWGWPARAAEYSAIVSDAESLVARQAN